jgi:hypothetical protein
VSADYRDFVIEDLAASEAALIERLVSSECDVRAYRELAHAAMDTLAHVITRLDRALAANVRLREEHRRLLTQLRAARPREDAA